MSKPTTPTPTLTFEENKLVILALRHLISEPWDNTFNHKATVRTAHGDRVLVRDIQSLALKLQTWHEE